MMKSLIILLLCVAGIPMSFVYADSNPLQNTTLIGTSQDMSIHIMFGEDTIKQLYSKSVTTNHTDKVILDLLGNDIILEDTNTKIRGDHFRISSDEVLIYGHKTGQESWRINVYVSLDEGIKRFSFY